jgi:hypothetical protein
MKKTKNLSLLFLGLLFFLPFVKLSPAQGIYVGVQEDDEFQWNFGVYAANWEGYFTDSLAATLGTLDLPIITNVYLEWFSWPTDPPQSHWPFTTLAIGSEWTGALLFPYDNSTITSTPVDATFGWKLSYTDDFYSYYNSTWYIVNDTSSFLRQTLNLSLAFSPYGIMSVLFAPKTINWTSFVTEFHEAMNAKGGLYKNISASVLPDGYSLNVPVGGFENNTEAIDVEVKYNSNSVLNYYEYSYGEKTLAKYWIHIPPIISENEYLVIIWSAVAIGGVLVIVLAARWVVKHN